MNDKKKNKKYVIPEAEILDFANDDIITLSNYGKLRWWGEEDDNHEDF